MCLFHVILLMSRYNTYWNGVMSLWAGVQPWFRAQLAFQVSGPVLALLASMRVSALFIEGHEMFGVCVVRRKIVRHSRQDRCTIYVKMYVTWPKRSLTRRNDWLNTCGVCGLFIFLSVRWAIWGTNYDGMRGVCKGMGYFVTCVYSYLSYMCGASVCVFVS